ncbi:quinoprotein dehydrogenase-associated putative ABC transporter substrate-binding protein [Pararhizobium haloflavum]|uniref:quinoprotein dehydrogenase-associated putative ABC transporter substrate-binding protein n=1 Tax=Pararhizobium haloflavum TaxID=2037914 RepID=UPI000C186E73|nr:quinoprotein dehydrogenase-associated putative ABC transporter substrate-binding protein [Pararhizobium haloflavum]
MRRTIRMLAAAILVTWPALASAQTDAPPPQSGGAPATPGGMGAVGAMQGGGAGAMQGGGQVISPLGEIVDRSRLRVCADPGNLPYSNDRGEGFENKIAELVADELGVPVEYTWFPQTIGFVRMTLGAARCDVVIGVATTNELMQNTNPYYRASYMIVHKPELELPSGDLADPAYQSLRIGIQPGTPGATTAARHGLLDQSKHYQLVVDTRIDKPARDMVQDVSDGVTDAALVWGPLAGYWIREIDPGLAMEPLMAASGTERIDYRVSMGIRYGEDEWKEELNQIILRKKPEIDAILQSYNVPLINNSGQLIIPMTLPDRADARPLDDAVPEPDGYRTEAYEAPVPHGVKGADTVDLAGMKDLYDSGEAVLIDVMPAQRKPADRPADQIWREPERETIRGAHWLANFGFGVLEKREEAAFRSEINRLAHDGDEARTLAFFCEPDCWMSWNAAKRAVSYGVEHVAWFPGGVAEWTKAGLPREKVKPWRPDPSVALRH